ncbi:MAG TPA: DoxX family membrane protein, partial [Burkholderiales bacterium]|nr:DoxX family membrane protein [Burkholderiales bacterium]
MMKRLLRFRAWLESVPYSVLALPLRFSLAWIFWSAGQVKLINWQRTIELFRDEYQVPVLPPELAAFMALS